MKKIASTAAVVALAGVSVALVTVLPESVFAVVKINARR
jgi:hypothetical protein